MDAPRNPIWDNVAPTVRKALSEAWSSGVPKEATALYARWWQLETWLRTLVYVERSARDGRRWADTLPPLAERRELRDAASGYMASPDAQARLAFLDAGDLMRATLQEDWDLYGDSLIDLDVWRGRAEELLWIRHRIGHCRRPHRDDLSRLEQTLRDLEPGGLRAISAYAQASRPDESLDDPIVEAWLRRSHSAANRLIDHALEQYDVVFLLRSSRRPWVDSPIPPGRPVTGQPGHLWHARFIHRSRPVNLRRLWEEISFAPDAHGAIVYLTTSDPFDIEVSFAAVDDPSVTADAIGAVFDAVLTSRDLAWSAKPTLDEETRAHEDWIQSHQDLEARVQVATPWSLDIGLTSPITLFGA